MSLATNITDLVTRVATEFKRHATMLNGNQADLSALTTTNKSNLVAALNEVKTAVDSAAETGGATNLDQLTDVVLTAPADEQVLGYDGAKWVNKDLVIPEIIHGTETDYGTVRYATLEEAAAAADAYIADGTLPSEATALSLGLYVVASQDILNQLGEKADVTYVDGVADLKADIADLAPAAFTGQFADMEGQLGTDQLPPLAISDVFSVASQQAMLALTAQRGDIAVRTDLGRVFILSTDDATILANWVELVARGDVVSVAGRTGAVVLSKGDVGLGSVDNTSDADKPVSTAVQTALGLKQDKDATLTALAALVTSANSLIYATGPDAFSQTTLTSFARQLLDDADAQTARATLQVYGTADIGDPATDFVAGFEQGLA